MSAAHGPGAGAADPARPAAAEAAPGAPGATARREPYRPIEDYAAIGDCHGGALVASDGSVDWCCLGRFDADPVFFRLLDAERGGHFALRPTAEARSERAYLPGTNILRTEHRTDAGAVAVTDFMPVGRRRGSGVHDYVTLIAPFRLVRIVEGLEGTVEMSAEYRPSVAFGRERARLEPIEGGARAARGPQLRSDLGWRIRGDLASARFRVGPGERRHLVVSSAPVPAEGLEARLERSLHITRSFWDEWSDYCRYNGPYRKAVERSALTLKLLTFAPTGAMVAAATTSLPEEIGGVRNWDYRFCWLRDAAFALYSLAAIGYAGEAEDFSQFLLRACSGGRALQVMYGIGGETELPELRLEHLEGYRGSAPVRIGNAAFDQRQLDVYGQVIDFAHLYESLGVRFGAPHRSLLRRLAEHTERHWREPDQGMWEVRSPPRHFVHGKIMAWAAFDRAAELLGDEGRWRALADEVAEAVRTRGVDPKGGHLRQAYEEPSPDASLLLAPLLRFPVERETFERTVAAVEQRLRAGDFVHRYLADDGVAGGEGAFLICSFWLVDALLALDRVDEARRLFERLLARANDVGLYAEEIDPATGAFLGNFPQAFTHLGLIQAAVNLQLVQRHGAEVMWGSHADRARHAVEAVSGPRALWAAFRRTGRVGRLFSSRDSEMPEAWMGEDGLEDWRAAALGWPVGSRVILSPFAASQGEQRLRRRGDV